MGPATDKHQAPTHRLKLYDKDNYIEKTVNLQICILYTISLLFVNGNFHHVFSYIQETIAGQMHASPIVYPTIMNERGYIS